MNSHLKIVMITLVYVGCLVLSSCETGCITNKEDLLGEWQVDSWIIESSGKSRSNQMDMQFINSGAYSVDYGVELEEGTYRIDCQYLHTQENGQAEKKVLIQSLSADTLVIQMNRSGSLEQVKLIKKP